MESTLLLSPVCGPECGRRLSAPIPESRSQSSGRYNLAEIPKSEVPNSKQIPIRVSELGFRIFFTVCLRVSVVKSASPYFTAVSVLGGFHHFIKEAQQVLPHNLGHVLAAVSSFQKRLGDVLVLPCVFNPPDVDGIPSPV